MLKTDLELSTTPQERDEALARHAAVSTGGDARSYINYVMAKVHAAKTAPRPLKPKVKPANPQIHHLERTLPSASLASILVPAGSPLPAATFPRTQLLIK
jgi:hypothetical protein